MADQGRYRPQGSRGPPAARTKGAARTVPTTRRDAPDLSRWISRGATPKGSPVIVTNLHVAVPIPGGRP
jgi:hypothetical protein